MVFNGLQKLRQLFKHFSKLYHQHRFCTCQIFHLLLWSSATLRAPDLEQYCIKAADRLHFFSRPIAPRHAKLAAYERELIGLVQAVKHWRPYLWGREFVVRTDHHSLKFLLDQRLSTIPQHHWAVKLRGFDFRVEYKPGAANVVADALSRRDEEASATMAVLSTPSFALFD